MKRLGLLLFAILVVVVQLGIPATLPAQQPAPTDPQAACRVLIERSRMTEEGQMLLQRLMRANETPALMDRLVHLAKSLGGGDLTAGLSRMLDTVERGAAERHAATGPADTVVPVSTEGLGIALALLVTARKEKIA